MRAVEGLLRLRNLVSQHGRGEIFQRHGIFGNHHGFTGSDIGKSAAQKKLLLRTAGIAGCKNTGPELRDQKRMIWQGRQIALLPRDNRFGEIGRHKLPLG